MLLSYWERERCQHAAFSGDIYQSAQAQNTRVSTLSASFSKSVIRSTSKGYDHARFKTANDESILTALIEVSVVVSAFSPITQYYISTTLLVFDERNEINDR